MSIGASSACFYPMETEKAFLRIAELGFKHSEIFFNSSCELKSSFVKELCTIRDAFGINVTSLHPYSSFSEGYDFFSKYERRFADGVESYKRYFEAAAALGAKYIVLHGSKYRVEIPTEEYARRFMKLNECANSFGCTVAHENVVNFSGATPGFMKLMKDYLGDSFKMVLDVKQARRADINPSEFIDIMGRNIVHVHLSDFNSHCDCMPPGREGFFDFGNLFTRLDKAGYDGKYIIELYSDNFSNEREISDSARYLNDILNKVKQS